LDKHISRKIREANAKLGGHEPLSPPHALTPAQHSKLMGTCDCDELNPIVYVRPPRKVVGRILAESQRQGVLEDCDCLEAFATGLRMRGMEKEATLVMGLSRSIRKAIGEEDR